MLRIDDIFPDSLVIDDLRATDRRGVFFEFAGLLAASGRVTDGEQLVRVLTDRESLGSTGIGDGVAIPHGKLKGLRQIVIAFGRSLRGVDFSAQDGKPAHLIFLLVAPEENPGDHLKVLARISRILKNPVLRDNLRKAPHRADIRRMIVEEDGRYSPR